MTNVFRHRRLLIGLLVVVAWTASTRAEAPKIETTLAKINASFKNMEVKLVEWPDELHTQLGDLKKIAFMAYPAKRSPGKLPLLISLHGGGGKTATVERQLERSARVKGLPLAEAAAKNLVLLEPNSAGSFDPTTLNKMLDYVLKTHDEIDQNRVYVMGHSMGGSGTWRWINASPERFAAAAPCGFSGGDEGTPSRLIGLPIWMMVGGADGANTPAVTKRVERLKEAGHPRAKLTVFSKANHSTANAAVFSSVELVDWMLALSRQR